PNDGRPSTNAHLETHTAPPPLPPKLSHIEMRTNRRAACKRWFPKSAHKEPSAWSEPSAESWPQSARKDRPMPSYPYSSPPAAIVHSQSPASPSAASAVSRRRCRHTSRHSKYSPEPAPPATAPAALHPEKPIRSR